MSLSRTRRAAVVAIGTAVLSLVASNSGAGAATQLHITRTLSSDFVGPLQFAVDGQQVLVADSFTGGLYRINRSYPLAKAPAGDGGDLSGVAIDPTTKAFAWGTTDFAVPTSHLNIRTSPGHVKRVDLYAYEKRANPDKAVAYGPTKEPSTCARDALLKIGAPAPLRYTGLLDSHPYGIAALGGNSWAVADAGGNDIVRVAADGTPSTIAVLPAVPVTFTKEIVASLGLPSCVVGVTYRFEGVPTDVEVAPDGALWVTTLPGGPDIGPGSLYRIGSSGKPVLKATGFAGATNLAISPSGTVYVAALGNGTVTAVKSGSSSVVATLPGLVSLEWANGHLYAGLAPALAGGKDPGSIVTLG